MPVVLMLVANVMAIVKAMVMANGDLKCALDLNRASPPPFFKNDASCQIPSKPGLLPMGHGAHTVTHSG